MTKPTIPGTYLFGLDDSRRGKAINRLCASFTKPENRERFLADEATYCDNFDLTPVQRAALLSRDWKALCDLGGSIFYVFKLAMVDQKSMQYLGGVFTGMSTEEFIAAMNAGGRNFG
jgi:protocatechuate 4,5-dioxygenase, alpha chain